MKSDLKSIVFDANLSAENKGLLVPGDMNRQVYGLYASCSSAVQCLTLMNRYGTSDEPVFAAIIGNRSGESDILPLRGAEDLSLFKFRGSSYMRAQTSTDATVHLSAKVLVTLAYKDEYE